ncbi:hypothetical protein GCM10020331_075090 [Ectobacillus funiculus]
MKISSTPLSPLVKILLMVNAGEITDKAIDSLFPYLDKGDILIDGGNTYFVDTVRRNKRLAEKKVSILSVQVFPVDRRAH